MSAFVTSLILLYVSSSIHVFLLLFLYVSLRQHILLYISDGIFVLFSVTYGAPGILVLFSVAVLLVSLCYSQLRTVLLVLFSVVVLLVSLCSSQLRTVRLVSLCSSQWRCSRYPCALLSGGAPGILAGTYCCQCVHLGRSAPDA